MKLRVVWVFFGIGLALMGCTGDDKPTTPQPIQASVTPAIDALPMVDDGARDRLESQYESLRVAQGEIEQLWRDLKAGLDVTCSLEFSTLLSPALITGEDALAGALYAAALDLNQAFQLWQAECQHPRPQVPDEIIDQGLRLALAAGDRLQEALGILTAA